MVWRILIIHGANVNNNIERYGPAYEKSWWKKIRVMGPGFLIKYSTCQKHFLPYWNCAKKWGMSISRNLLVVVKTNEAKIELINWAWFF